MVALKRQDTPSRQHTKKKKKKHISLEIKHQRKPLMLKLTLGTNLIEQIRERRVLGVTLDKVLNWQSPIDIACKQIGI